MQLYFEGTLLPEVMFITLVSNKLLVIVQQIVVIVFTKLVTQQRCNLLKIPARIKGSSNYTNDWDPRCHRKIGDCVYGLTSVCVIKLPFYWSSGFSRVAQFISEKVLRFRFALGSFHRHLKNHEGRAFTPSHFMSQYKPITKWEYSVAFAVKNTLFIMIFLCWIDWEISGKENKFQRQYFDVCTSSANNIGVTGQTGQRCHLAMQICQWTTQPIHTSETTSRRFLKRIWIESKNDLSFKIFTCFFLESLFWRKLRVVAWIGLNIAVSSRRKLIGLVLIQTSCYCLAELSDSRIKFAWSSAVTRGLKPLSSAGWIL